MVIDFDLILFSHDKFFFLIIWCYSLTDHILFNTPPPPPPPNKLHFGSLGSSLPHPPYCYEVCLTAYVVFISITQLIQLSKRVFLFVLKAIWDRAI